MNEIRELVQGLEWWEFYDVCEELVRISWKPEELASEIRLVIRAGKPPYRMTPMEFIGGCRSLRGVASGSHALAG